MQHNGRMSRLPLLLQALPRDAYSSCEASVRKLLPRFRCRAMPELLVRQELKLPGQQQQQQQQQGAAVPVSAALDGTVLLVCQEAAAEAGQGSQDVNAAVSRELAR